MRISHAFVPPPCFSCSYFLGGFTTPASVNVSSTSYSEEGTIPTVNTFESFTMQPAPQCNSRSSTCGSGGARAIVPGKWMVHEALLHCIKLPTHLHCTAPPPRPPRKQVLNPPTYPRMHTHARTRLPKVDLAPVPGMPVARRAVAVFNETVYAVGGQYRWEPAAVTDQWGGQEEMLTDESFTYNVLEGAWYVHTQLTTNSWNL